MKENEIYEKITALVDSEISSEAEQKDIMQKIDGDSDLRFEYFVQLSIKSFLNKRYLERKAPSRIKESIQQKIYRENFQLNKTDRTVSALKAIFKPKYSVAYVAVLILVAIYYVFKPVTPEYLAWKQSGKDNFYVKGLNNFNDLEEGKLKLTFANSSADMLYRFFKLNGVDYDIEVEEKKYWQLVGAVISEEKGKRMAHHVYSDESGHLVYVFQTDTNYCGINRMLKLSEDMISRLEKGPLLIGDNGSCSAIWKKNSNYFVLFSNDDTVRIREEFLSKN